MKLAPLVGLIAASQGLLVASPAAVRSGRVGGPVCSEQVMSPVKLQDAAYDGNLAQYLVHLHDSRAAFDFCGGMLFQLVLSDKLRSHLSEVAASGPSDTRQPLVFDAATKRMNQIPGHVQSGAADHVQLFHGREVRQVPDAAGGMGFVLQLSHAGEDPEGWTPQEREGYDGWGHDAGRVWRNGERLEREGFVSFRGRFGEKAFALHHRFYLHLDDEDRLWLSAEDGCEGVYPPSPKRGKPAWMPF